MNDYPSPDRLFEPIQALLASSLSGLSEYELLTQLASEDAYFNYDRTDSLALFQRHFLLFHCLYLLQHDLLRSQTGVLQISALEIRLWPYRAGVQGLGPADPLRDYYLDISNLETTNLEQVDDLLENFWVALARNESRSEALSLLGLADPIDDGEIRRRYKQLVMQHHPDRGGDGRRLQQFNFAISQLLPKI